MLSVTTLELPEHASRPASSRPSSRSARSGRGSPRPASRTPTPSQAAARRANAQQHVAQRVLQNVLDAVSVEARLAAALAEHQSSVHAAFLAMDPDRSGYIERDEFRQLLAHYTFELSDGDFAALMRRMDTDGDGRISYAEFLESVGVKMGATEGYEGAYFANEAADRIEKKRKAERQRQEREYQAAQRARMIAGSVGAKGEQRRAGDGGAGGETTAETVHKKLCEAAESKFGSLRRAFRAFDDNGDGSISVEEFKAVLSSFALETLSHGELSKLLEIYDPNKDGRITYREFLDAAQGEQRDHEVGMGVMLSNQANQRRALLGSRQQTPPRGARDGDEGVAMEVVKTLQAMFKDRDADGMAAVFRLMDKDGSGRVDRAEFAHVLRTFGVALTRAQLDALLGLFDTDVDGGVSHTEFLKVLKPQRPADHSHEVVDHSVAQASLIDAITARFHDLRQAFLMMDDRHQGFISRANFRRVLDTFAIRLTDAEFNALAQLYDKDNDDKITYAEFVQSFSGTMQTQEDDSGMIHQLAARNDAARAAYRQRERDLRAAQLHRDSVALHSEAGSSAASTPEPEPAAPVDSVGPAMQPRPPKGRKPPRRGPSPSLAANRRAMLQPFNLNRSQRLQVAAVHRRLQQQLNRLEMHQALHVLERFQEDGSGSVSTARLEEVMARSEHMRSSEFNRLLELYDGASGATISFAEFAAVFKDLLPGNVDLGKLMDEHSVSASAAAGELQRRLLQEGPRNAIVRAFEKFDTDGNGVLSVAEFRSVLLSNGMTFNDADWGTLMHAIGGGKVPECVGFVQLCRLFHVPLQAVVDTTQRSNQLPSPRARARPGTSHSRGSRASRGSARSRSPRALGRPGTSGSARSRPVTADGRADSVWSVSLREPIGERAATPGGGAAAAAPISPRMAWRSARDVEARVAGQVLKVWNKLQRALRTIDERRVGYVPYAAFDAALQHFGVKLSAGDLAKLHDKYDRNQDGHVFYQDFVHFIVSRGQAGGLTQDQLQPARAGETPSLEEVVAREWRALRAAFKRFDKDGSGRITTRQFRAALNYHGVTFSESEFFSMMTHHDPDMDGHIVYDSFLRVYLGGQVL